MRSTHSIKLSDDELRMIIIGLDVYSDQWSAYSKKRKRDGDFIRGVRINSPEEQSMIELSRSDVLAANARIAEAVKLRDHLAKFLRPSDYA